MSVGAGRRALAGEVDWRQVERKERALVHVEGSGPVAVGIDAAVVANHHVVVRRPEAGSPGVIVDEFTVAPTLAGMAGLSKRLAAFPGVMAVAEPTSMTWLPLAVALGEAGGSLALIGNRHSARLRSALAGKNKSDPVDAAMLSRAGEFFSLEPARIPGSQELALRRAAQRRGKAMTDANRCLRRVISLARWAFPDVWNAFGGSRSTALAVLGRWPSLTELSRARAASIADVVAGHTRGVHDVADRATSIRKRSSVMVRVLGWTSRPRRSRLGDPGTARRSGRRGGPSEPGHRDGPMFLAAAVG
jgi:hypothetical protein